MDDVISNLDKETEVKCIIRKVGQSHAVLNNACSFQSNLWEHLGEIAMEKICHLDAIQVCNYGKKRKIVTFFIEIS